MSTSSLAPATAPLARPTAATDDGEPTTRPAHELAEVVARNVLDDLAAGVDDRAVREHERDAEHEVAWGAEAVT